MQREIRNESLGTSGSRQRRETGEWKVYLEGGMRDSGSERLQWQSLYLRG